MSDDAAMVGPGSRGSSPLISRLDLDQLEAVGNALSKQSDARKVILTLIASVRELKKDNEQLYASLPFHSGRDENKVHEQLGEVFRHETNAERKASIGVVEVNRAKQALLHAYAEANELNERVRELEGALRPFVAGSFRRCTGNVPCQECDMCRAVNALKESESSK